MAILICHYRCMDDGSHGVDGLEANLLALDGHLAGGLAGESEAAADEGELLLGVDLGVELLLEVGHAEHGVPVPHVDVVLLDVGELVEESPEEGGHLLVELLDLQLHDVLVGVLDELLADGLLRLPHPPHHPLVLLLLLVVVLLAALLVRVHRLQVLRVHVLQKVLQGLHRRRLVRLLQAGDRVPVGVGVLVVLGGGEEALDLVAAEGVPEEVVGLLLLHVPAGDLQPELLELEALDDVVVELAEEGHQLGVGGVPLLELPVRHLRAHLLAGDVQSRLLDEVEHQPHVLDLAAAQVVGVEPEGAHLLVLQPGQDVGVEPPEVVVAHVEPVEDDLERLQLLAPPHPLLQVHHEVLQHPLLVLREVPVPAALQRQLHDRTRPHLVALQLLLERLEVRGGEELARTLVEFVDVALGHQTSYTQYYQGMNSEHPGSGALPLGQLLHPPPQLLQRALLPLPLPLHRPAHLEDALDELLGPPVLRPLLLQLALQVLNPPAQLGAHLGVQVVEGGCGGVGEPGGCGLGGADGVRVLLEV